MKASHWYVGEENRFHLTNFLLKVIFAGMSGSAAWCAPVA
jgi:hypothetical protein